MGNVSKGRAINMLVLKTIVLYIILGFFDVCYLLSTFEHFFIFFSRCLPFFVKNSGRVCQNYGQNKDMKSVNVLLKWSLPGYKQKEKVGPQKH